MKKTTGSYLALSVDAAGTGVASHAGLLLAVETVRALGLDGELSGALAPWRKPLAVQDPAKVFCDLALPRVAGGDCLADVALLRAEPALFGPVASDPTVSRIIDALAADAPKVLAAISTARAAVRKRAWAAAGAHAPCHEASAAGPVVIDVDATLVTAHSDKEQAAPTFKRGYGFHPLCAFLDHGEQATGSRWRCCCARATPGRTPPPTTSPSSRSRCVSCPVTAPGAGPARAFWCASTAPAAPTSCWSS